MDLAPMCLIYPGVWLRQRHEQKSSRSFARQSSSILKAYAKLGTMCLSLPPKAK